MRVNSIREKNISEDVVNKHASMLRDPTKPLDYVIQKPIETDVLILQAVFVRSGSKSAIINGESVNVGDVIADHKIVSIDERTVILEKENNKITLNLRGGMRDFRP